MVLVDDDEGSSLVLVVEVVSPSQGQQVDVVEELVEELELELVLEVEVEAGSHSLSTKDQVAVAADQTHLPRPIKSGSAVVVEVEVVEVEVADAAASKLLRRTIAHRNPNPSSFQRICAAPSAAEAR